MTAVPLRLIDDIGMRKLTSAAAKDLMEDHLTHYAVRNILKLTVSKQLRKPPTQHDPSKNYQFRYRAKRHSTLPHVVKFSGGRSSGMLLFTLLENWYHAPSSAAGGPGPRNHVLDTGSLLTLACG